MFKENDYICYKTNIKLHRSMKNRYKSKLAMKYLKQLYLYKALKNIYIKV